MRSEQRSAKFIVAIAVLYVGVLIGIYFIFRRNGECVNAGLASAGGELEMRSGPRREIIISEGATDEGTDTEYELEQDALRESESGSSRPIALPDTVTFQGSKGSYNDMDYTISPGGMGQDVVDDDVAEQVPSRDMCEPVKSGKVKYNVQKTPGFAERLEKASGSWNVRRVKPREVFESMAQQQQPQPQPQPQQYQQPHRISQDLQNEMTVESRVTPQRFHEKAGLGTGIPQQVHKSKVIYPSEDGMWGGDVSDPNPTSTSAFGNANGNAVSMSPEERIMAAQRSVLG